MTSKQNTMCSVSIRKFFGAALCMAALSAAFSCADDDACIDPAVSEDRPTEVSLSWSTSDMDLRTRAAISEEAEHTVNSLWIGIYDYATGRIKKLSWTDADGTAVESLTGRFIEPNVTIGDHVLNPTDAVRLHTLSGRSRIVAVANVDNYGKSSHAELRDWGTVPLRDLLKQCDTWEKYCSVAALAFTPGTDGMLNVPNITLTDANMPMAGIYYPLLDHNQGSADPVDWTDDAVNCVDLPAGAVKLPGTIHLRRLHAYVDFRIIPAENITFEPISWVVHNVPYASYCQERSGAEQNAGDAALLGSDYEDNYASSRLSRVFERRDDLGAQKNESGLQFSYYQFENKHTALAKSAEADYTGAAVYKDREREWKNAAAANTGIYKSLTASPAGDANNMASYVEIQAKVTYHIKGQQADGTGGTITSADDPDAKPRMGFATYTVHLGYCEGKNAAGGPTEATARDFNCRRNTRYTYTVRINGLNDIVVEAISDTPAPANDTPGAEGDVTDYEGNNVIELDCHYGVFNIRMTNRERTNLYWRIKTPYGDGLEVRSYADHVGIAAQPENRKDPFYNWIRFKPTTGERVLASYRDNNVSDTAADEALWTLEDLRDVPNHPHTQGNADPEDDTSRWYTVFVDEYAYLLDAGGAAVTDWKSSDWTKYVNLDDRVAWLIIDRDSYETSPDGESIYSKVKYLISQHSIQTYYSTDNPNRSHTALGVEHYNETFGKNLTWTWNADSGYDLTQWEGPIYFSDLLSHSNGRWNCWKYLTNSTCTYYGSWTSGTPKQWSALVDFSTPDAVYPVASLVSTPSGGVRATGTMGSSDPDTSNEYYEILGACMSRNRDLNGNGRIDENELRWYLPAEGKYERIMLGRNALRSWLFNPTMAPWYTTSGDPYARKALDNQALLQDISSALYADGVVNWVHYASSDHRKFFAEEAGSWNPHLSLHWQPGSVWGADSGRWPWNIRCVRNLGVTMSEVTVSPDADPVERAYTYDADTRIFNATSYADNCLRASIQTFLPVHTIRDLDRNLVARRFEVAAEDATAENVPNAQIEEYLNDNRPCRDYSQNGDGARWRIPNQREAMMMLSEGIFPDTGERLTCTKEGYGRADRFVATTSLLTMSRITAATYTIRVRCVRDVQ